jgi:hypothetical protein
MLDSLQLKSEIERYEFINSLDIFILCIALCDLKNYSEAFSLYKKFETEIKESNNEIIGLKMIISVCKEKKDAELLEKFERKLEKIVH